MCGLAPLTFLAAARFDIDVSRIWETALAEPMQTEAWFDSEDFAEAINIARERFKEKTILYRPSISSEQ